MVMTKCERCGSSTAKPEMCSSCRRLVCKKCKKTAKKVSRKDIKRMMMCKDCWTSLEKRKWYRRFTAPQETFEERTERYGPRPRYGAKRSFGGGPKRRTGPSQRTFIPIFIVLSPIFHSLPDALFA